MPEPIQAMPGSRFGSILPAALLILGGLIIVNTIIYYAYGTTRLTSILVLLLTIVSLVIWKKKYGEKPSASVKITPKIKLPGRLILSFLVSEAILFAALIINRTASLMPSPWQAVGPWFFILYAVATALLFSIIIHKPLQLPVSSFSDAEVRSPYGPKDPSDQFPIIHILTSLHLFLTFSVTAILYPLGWGFDAFVHRATEVWIQNNGFILPKQPYYIGQYSLVVWLSNLTAIPIFLIDVYLVPVLASLLLPATIAAALKRVWQIESGALFVWLIPFVPFLHLHLTTPYNLALLFSIVLIFVVFMYLRDERRWWLVLVLAGATLVTHPLLGAPMTLFALTAIAVKKMRRWQAGSLAIGMILVTLIVPTMFIVNNLRQGLGWPTLTNPLTRFDHFLALFARPYWYLDTAPFVYELLYGWQLLIVPTVIVLAIVGWWMIKRETNNSLHLTSYSLSLIYPATALAFIVSAWLLKSWVFFPDVVAYEQGDFPLRILKASLIFAIPYAMYGVYKIIVLTKKRKVTWVMFHVSCVMLLMLSLYLSYPQRNIKARFPGYNVTVSDFKAVEWIHEREKSEIDYIVLANQLVSAAALTNYSFAKYFETPEGKFFYYSVPTGGPQYQEYGRMLYEGQKREYVEAAMDRVGVETAYFVLNTYWANSDKIIEGAKKSADSWHVIDEGKVWIFVYSR